ncbi:MAG: PTS system mannose/fructose/sorbose family transporter subunit IID [bacterium]|nr:MAG: PTS system mannose/fructose/sorbose family transporter subunit IID [bacterium]
MEKRPGLAERIRFLLRSLSLQGSWCFQHMQGLGFFYILSPWLAKLHPENPKDSLRRHTAFFNTNPYMASYLIGVVSRLEADGRSEETQGAKSALMGPLGANGDGLFWATLCPLSAVLGICMAFFSPLAGILLMLATFNAFGILTRWKLFERGYDGADKPLEYIVERKDRVLINKLSSVLTPLLGFLLGSVGMKTGIPGTVMAVFLVALGLTLRKQRTWPVLWTVITVSVLLGVLGLRMEMPWFPLK